MGTSDFLKTIFDFLNTETEYAVLRNLKDYRIIIIAVT